MSYMQFQQECKDCNNKWNAALGIVGITQIAAPPKVCPFCLSANIVKVADGWDNLLNEMRALSCGELYHGRQCLREEGHKTHHLHSDHRGTTVWTTKEAAKLKELPTRKCVVCNADITACMGLVKAGDLSSALAGTRPYVIDGRSNVRELCESCGLIWNWSSVDGETLIRRHLNMSAERWLETSEVAGRIINSENGPLEYNENHVIELLEAYSQQLLHQHTVTLAAIGVERSGSGWYNKGVDEAKKQITEILADLKRVGVAGHDLAEFINTRAEAAEDKLAKLTPLGNTITSEEAKASTETCLEEVLAGRVEDDLGEVWPTQAQELYNETKAKLIEVTSEAEELQQLFDLQHTRTIKADKLWQAAHDKPNVLPDLGVLIEWLLKRATIAEAELLQRGQDSTKYCDSLRKKIEEQRAGWEHQVLVRADLERKVENLTNQLAQHHLDTMKSVQEMRNRRADAAEAQTSIVTNLLRSIKAFAGPHKRLTGTISEGTECNLCRQYVNSHHEYFHHETCLLPQIEAVLANSEKQEKAMSENSIVPAVEIIQALVGNDPRTGYPWDYDDWWCALCHGPIEDEEKGTFTHEEYCPILKAQAYLAKFDWARDMILSPQPGKG